ncbi:MAG: DUF1517 domain-containing protein [Cyanobacteriota bacterium]|nr:DUF1517 domain-containing protein [Cyanobacteriota bacterium]
MVVPILLGNILLLAPHSAEAASGGRIGGGSFRSAPSPRSYGGGGSRYRGSGGVGGGYVPTPYGGGGFPGGYGGGFGLPFIVPIFGFGGGLFGFLLLMAVVGLVVNALRGGSAGPDLGGLASDDSPALSNGPVSLAQVQVGLLPAAKELQADLRRLAATADTNTSAGLRQVLQETSLSLLRNPELWVYANAEAAQVAFSTAEDTFNRLSMQERSKLRKEVVTNVGGRRDQVVPAVERQETSAVSSDYIAVTLLVASRNRLVLKDATSAESLRDALQQLGAISADDLMALEVIWQPEGVGEVLTTEELLTAYPQLQHL